ncbi:MAG TPA: DinB family protein [Acidimicrobiia bacterium]|nr:DinB family protein [Acidimicrobiia bacterium]
MDRCDGCQFEYDLTAAPDAGAHIIDGAAQLADLLRGVRDVRTRPQPATWSPLEYGCHVRDVLLVQRERTIAARLVECPTFDPMGRDERVDYDGYSSQDPIRVARQLDDAAFLFANVLARLAPGDWDRTVIYNYPKRFERPLRWVAVHTVHEVRHHLADVRRQLQ